MAAQDFLVEIGCEELPPKALNSLSQAFLAGITQSLTQQGIAFTGSRVFATPRRLAVRLEQLASAQPDKAVERRGPAVAAAFDAAGNPTRALEGFAGSLGVTPDHLDTLETDKGAWLVYRSMEQGKPTVELLPGIVESALAGLPIPKRMRWGASRVEFVRPVHWVVMLFGSQVVDCNILGIAADNQTRGHRFHCARQLIVPTPADYEVILREEGRVIAAFDERKTRIREAVIALGQTAAKAQVVIDEALLDEVTALNEWPVPLLGHFESRFLDVPAEALISSMKSHQKYFHLVDAEQKMLPMFITVANIDSKGPQQVVAGNEKVIRPRLSDAAFFYETDRRTPLHQRIDSLKSIIFQEKLGSIYDKSVRVAALAKRIASAMHADPEAAARAAMLAKTDLVSAMVLEFPELQGIMGAYYAQHDGEPGDIPLAINEQYLPRFAGDQLPSSPTGLALALADRLDSLVGLFSIGQPPSGTRDPFALRRAALGVLRMMVECGLTLDLQACVSWSAETYGPDFLGKGITASSIEAVVDYVLERFRAGYEEQGIPVEVFLAVQARKPTQPLDFDHRVRAVEAFRQLPAAAALAAANKRVSNILNKQAAQTATHVIDEGLLHEAAEKQLAQAVAAQARQLAPLCASGQYAAALNSLAALREPIDQFFDQVMVMAEDEQVRNNRLALLGGLRNLFLQVADISLLPSGNPA